MCFSLCVCGCVSFCARARARVCTSEHVRMQKRIYAYIVASCYACVHAFSVCVRGPLFRAVTGPAKAHMRDTASAVHENAPLDL